MGPGCDWYIKEIPPIAFAVNAVFVHVTRTQPSHLQRCVTKHRILKPDCRHTAIRQFDHFWVWSLGLTVTTVVQLAHKCWTFEYLYVIYIWITVVCISCLSPEFINLLQILYKYNSSNILFSTAFSEPTSNIYIFPTRQKNNLYRSSCLQMFTSSLPSWSSMNVCTFCIQSL